jgi:diaminopimelate decarboxylase/aspartate kinase
VRYIDVGGGLGVPEKVGQPGLHMCPLDAVLTEIKQGCGGRSLFLVPGRFVVAQAGVLFARVTQTNG